MQAVPKIKNSAPGPDHAPFAGVLSCVRWDLPRSISIPNLKFLASLIPNLWKGLKLKNWPLNPDHAPFGVFVTLEMGYAKVYLYTEFEVSSFSRGR